MAVSCGCGTRSDHAVNQFGCIECGAPCCPGCAVPLESAMYCRGCARSLVGTTVLAGGPFDLH